MDIIRLSERDRSLAEPHMHDSVVAVQQCICHDATATRMHAVGDVQRRLNGLIKRDSDYPFCRPC